LKRISKYTIGKSGRFLIESILLREGLNCREGDEATDLVISLSRPKREYLITTTTNLKPKKAGGKGKYALDWWISTDCRADFVACADLSTLRAWIFKIDEIPGLAQQRTSNKYHLYMYTSRKVALRGKQEMKFDYEFGSYRLQNRVHRRVFAKK